ncbi:hypothetical protein DMB66_18875 [Actinoplanes sp. ATCC 53533]|nr:hypothetical protein DMB66_18875 [Actinoplanes sp. ATCC 53533]
MTISSALRRWPGSPGFGELHLAQGRQPTIEIGQHLGRIGTTSQSCVHRGTQLAHQYVVQVVAGQPHGGQRPLRARAVRNGDLAGSVARTCRRDGRLVGRSPAIAPRSVSVIALTLPMLALPAF